MTTIRRAVSIPGAVLASDRSARAAWSQIAEPDDPRVTALIAEHGPVDGLVAALSSPAPTHRIFAQRAARTDLGAAAEFARRHGIAVLIPGDPQWPQGVDDLACPPVCLWIRGEPDLSALRRRSVAVVGSRTSTAYGDNLAGDIAAGIAERGFAVVSGAAFGIDRAAHLGALAVGGRTIAVLAGGVDRPYPAAHTALLQHIASVGSVVSEAPPGWAPTRPRFLLRNRLIATMTSGTVVVEAGLRSGSLNTARCAELHSRPVGAVPGPVTSAVSAGCHQAVRDGLAVLVTDAAEVVDLMGVLGADSAPHVSGPVRPEDRLGPVEALTFAAVPHRAPASIEDIACAAGLTPLEVMGALARLELEDFVVQGNGGWKRRPTRTRGSRQPEGEGCATVET